MQDNYQALIDAIRDYAIYMLDVTGRVASWNAGAEQLKGYKADEVLGEHFSLFFTPEDRAANKPARELETALTSGRFEEEGWRIRKDGRRFWANIILTPVHLESGEHIGFAKVTRDLTEKRRTEELYLLLVNQVKEYAIFMLDPEGNILTWNEGAELIKGYAPAEIIGKHFSVFYIQEDLDAEKPRRELEIAVSAGKYEEQGWRIRKDGSRFWANVIITPIYTDHHIGFAKVTRDLTQHREAEQMRKSNAILEATNNELERFSATVSHDLKEPLRKVLTFSNLLLTTGTSLPEQHRSYLEKIHNASRRMNTMITDILDFSTLGKPQTFERVPLSDIMSATIDMLEQDIAEKNAIVKYGELPEAIVIPSQMRQLFQNIISNSLKFSKKDVPPEIEVKTCPLRAEEIDTPNLWPADLYLQITFSDNGIGFKQSEAERIFRLFDRLHAKKDFDGTGLGLAICRKIASNHGGSLTARSEPGAGSEFTLLIPA